MVSDKSTGCDETTAAGVLILVLMEYGLWRKIQDEEIRDAVLILVLMEYGLWPDGQHADGVAVSRLNPCSNGIWSLT